MQYLLLFLSSQYSLCVKTYFAPSAQLHFTYNTHIVYYCTMQ